MKTYGAIRAPSLRLEIDPQIDPQIDLMDIDWDTATSFMLTDAGNLVWTLYDGLNGNILFQSTEYTVGADGSLASFSHTFPPLDNGDTLTIKQDVRIAVS